MKHLSQTFMIFYSFFYWLYRLWGFILADTTFEVNINKTQKVLLLKTQSRSFLEPNTFLVIWLRHQETRTSKFPSEEGPRWGPQSAPGLPSLCIFPLLSSGPCASIGARRGPPEGLPARLSPSTHASLQSPPHSQFSQPHTIFPTSESSPH